MAKSYDHLENTGFSGFAAWRSGPVETFVKNIANRPCVPEILLLHAAPPDKFGTYHDAVVAELVDAQR